MRLIRWIAATVVLASLSPQTPHAVAQQPLHVLRHMPFDSVQSGEAIVVVFDRAVAGSVERAPDPNTFVRVEPALAGVIQWRDPQTIRIIPNEALPRLGRYTITVGAFSAADGGRLTAPYVFTVHTFGPRFVGQLPALYGPAGELIEPNGEVTLIYTAPVDTAEVSRVTRFELERKASCVGGTIRFRVTSMRPALISEMQMPRFLYRYDVTYPFRTAVLLKSEVPIPEGCSGTWVVPTFGVAGRRELRRPAVTMPQFRMASLECTADDCARTPAFRLRFSAPVGPVPLLQRLRIEPATPFTIDEAASGGAEWVIRLPVKLNTTYRVRVDSTLTDSYGRKLSGEPEIALRIGDRRPALGHQLGFFTVSRENPVLRITHVNADSVDLAIVPIPDSLRAAVVAASMNPDSAARLVGRLRDTVHHVVVLPQRPNEDQLTDVRLPAAVLGQNRAALLAIRGRPFLRTPAPTLVGPHRPGELPEITIIGSLEEPSNFVALVQVTDLLAHARVDLAWGSVFVTNVNDGQPVAGASVMLRDNRGQIAANGTTDATGVANLQRTPNWRSQSGPESSSQFGWYYGPQYFRFGPRIVEVTRGADRSMTLVFPDSRESRLLDADFADGSYDRDRVVRGMVYTDRAIYRPGEPVYVGAMLRQGWLGDLTVPRADSVRIRIESTDGGPNDAEMIRSVVRPLNDFGSAADSLVLSRAATIGYYMLRLEAIIDSSWHTVAWGGFSVAEYRAPEFKATVTLDTVVRSLGDTIRAQLDSRYYFGAAMAGAVVQWSAYTSRLESRLPIPGLPDGFVIGRARDYYGPADPSDASSLSGVDTLDATGSVVLTIPTKPGTLNEPGQLDVTAAVEDLNRQTVTATASTPLHASDVYVAVRDPRRDWYWKRDAARSLEVMAVRPDGRRVSGMHVGILVLRHRWVWSYSGNFAYSQSTWVTDTIARDSLVTSDSIVRYTFTPRGGDINRVLFTIRDAHRRPVTTSISRYVMSGDDRFAAGRSPIALSMHVTPDTVALGDTVRVQFISPYQRAEAWVTIEREGILAQRRVTVGAGETTVPFVVADAFFPDATVSVMLIDSTAAWRTDSLHNRTRTARATLNVARSPKQLRVDVIAAKDRYEPGDSARITVRLRDDLMRPVSGEVTLWAVDESVIALAEYEVPDPYATMYESRGSGLTFASTMAVLAQLGRNLRPNGWYRDFYGRAAGNSAVSLSRSAARDTAASALRSNFKTTAFFLSGLRTDSNGSVTAVVRLPDNLTTYRLIAVAGTVDSRFGGGQASLLITKPLLARSSLPLFLRTGDELLAGAVLTNQTATRANVNVRASARAASIAGAAHITRALGADSSGEVRFGWLTRGEPGDTAAFRFDIDGGGYGDAVLTSLPVRPPYSPRFHSATGVARGNTSVRMYLPRELDPVRSRLTLRVGTTPVAIVRSAYWRLHVYPYQCTEQVTSAGGVIVGMLRLQRAGLLDSTVAPRSVDLRRELQTAVDVLSRRQTQAGGIGYWGPADWTDARLTTYSGSLLLSARELGVPVPERTLSRIASYLTSMRILDDTLLVQEYQRRAARATGLGQQLARLTYLRRAGVPDGAGEAEIVHHESEMVWEDRLALAQLIGSRGDRAVAREVLARAWRPIETAGNRLEIPDSLIPPSWFPSRVRPSARLVQATLALDPDNPRVLTGIETIVSQQRAVRGWIWNTQDYAAAAAALSDIAMWQRTTEASGSVTVRSVRTHRRDRVVMTSEVKASQDSTISLDGLVERDGDWLVLPLRLEGGALPVYYSLTVEEIPKSQPTKSDARGVIVERWFERFDDGKPATEVQEGELVRGRLRITLPAMREFLAVEDMLPAGLEVVDLSLQTSSTLAPYETEASNAAKAAGDRANRGQSRFGTWYGDWWSPWEHQEIRDDRVVYFARALEKGTYTATYVARATTAGTFVRPPAHAEEMYNPSLGGRSEGGVFRIRPR